MSASIEDRPLDANADFRPLADGELDQASGGMKWVPGTVNPDVIDARGGSWSMLGIRWTRGHDGNLTSLKFG